MSQLKNTLQFARKLAELGMSKGGNLNYTKTLMPLSKYYKFGMYKRQLNQGKYETQLIITISYQGLLSDDLMKESNDVIAEAVRRLPKEVFDERQFRLSRAIQYNSGKTILPESQWTKPEEVRTFIFYF